MKKLTHFNEDGAAHMVDVSAKAETEREAVAEGRIFMQPETLSLIRDRRVAKGDVLGVARLAGIMAAKKTDDLIPLCHTLDLLSADVALTPDVEHSCVTIRAVLKTVGRTGVEMEALTAVSVAALTVYDMCKSTDRTMTISDVRLVKKSGGRSGTFERGR